MRLTSVFRTAADKLQKSAEIFAVRYTNVNGIVQASYRIKGGIIV